MQRITITEVDNTSQIGILSGDDIVFVPGFADPTGDIKESYIKQPVLCTSVVDFENYFGSTPAKFSANQTYGAAGGTFSPEAIPSEILDIDNEEVTVKKSGKAELAHKNVIVGSITIEPATVTAKDIDYAKGTFTCEGANESDIIQVTYSYMSAEADTVMFYANDPDPGYIYAKELLSSGLQVLYYRVNEATDEISTKVFYDAITDLFDPTKSALLDKGTYSVKYLTTGGYPNYEFNSVNLATNMVKCAAARGDCIALIDHTNNPGRALSANDPTSVYHFISTTGDGSRTICADGPEGSFGTMFTPWAKYTAINNYPRIEDEDEGHAVVNLDRTINMPASFAYLRCLASSIKNNPNWLAIAGVSRGLVPGLIELNTDAILTNKIAEDYANDKGVSINPITNIRPYGFTIWGNRTLLNYADGVSGFATRFINIRNLCGDIKKRAFSSAQALMFEQNNDVLWVNFKSMITPLLDQMVTGYGLKSYKIIKVPTVDRTKLNCNIRIRPEYAVESFDIAVVLTDEDVTISE